MNSFPDPKRAQELFSDLKPSSTIEGELRAEFRRYHRGRRVGSWMMRAGAAAAAACALVFVLTRPSSRHSPDAPEFYPLPGMQITPEMLNSVQIIRVELEPGALAQFGFLGSGGGPVDAELLFTEDGLTRAIRLIPENEEN